MCTLHRKNIDTIRASLVFTTVDQSSTPRAHALVHIPSQKFLSATMTLEVADILLICIFTWKPAETKATR